MIKRIRNKLIEKKGLSVTIENLIYFIIGSVFVGIIIFLFGLFYTEYKLNNFTAELVRTAELVGEIGTETDKREEELQKSLAIKPLVIWSETGKIDLNETITVTCKLDYKIKIPFWNTVFNLEKIATGRSEIYWK